MAQLSDLPNEIILLILPLVLPDYIENFSGACTKHYSLAAAELKKHRALKREHTVYEFPNFRLRGVSRLLDKVLREPRIAFYVREITLSGWGPKWDSDPDSDVFSPWSVGFPMRLDEALSPVVPEEDIRWGWKCEIPLGSEDHVLSLLFFLLPNLSKLRLEGFGSERAKLHDTLDRIARTESPNPPLSSLRHVDLLCAWDVRGARMLRLFTALPSIRSIHVERLGNHVSYSDLSITELAPQSSKLEELTLLNCQISFESLEYILTGLNALRSFTFVATKYLDFHSTWFRDALFAVAPKLESLTLLTRDEKRNVIADLRIFKSLRNLHTETQLLLDYFLIHLDEASLAKALPPNLQTLTLECSGQGDRFAIAKYLAKLAELKKYLVPQLKEVEVCTRNGIQDFNGPPYGGPFCDRKRLYSYEALVEVCQARGFSFWVTKLEVEVSRDFMGYL